LVPSAGAVVQMVHSTEAGTSSSTTSTSYVDTGMNVTITPKFSNSKILVLLTTQIGTSASSGIGTYPQARMDFRITDSSGSAVIFDARYAGTDAQGEGNLSVITHAHGVYTASSTSALTFKAQARPAGGLSAEASNMFLRFYSGSLHTMTAMEIAQ